MPEQKSKDYKHHKKFQKSTLPERNLLNQFHNEIAIPESDRAKIIGTGSLNGHPLRTKNVKSPMRYEL
jgi:hypothetical protein